MNRRHFLGTATLLSPPAFALMAGAAPDSPTRRLDPNRAESPYASVASLMGGGSFSAVCIAPSFALTAAHTVTHPHNQFLCLNLDGDLSHRYALKQVWTPAAVPKHDPALPAGDLALVEIDGRFPEGLAFAPLASGPAQEGQRVELCGYGASGFGDRGVSVDRNPMLKRIGANRIDRLLRSDDDAKTALLYFFSFDAPPLPPKRGASLGNDVETGLANGDSGSPAFVRENGRLALLGINTFVMRNAAPGAPPNGFGTVGGGQVLAAHKTWLLSRLGPQAWPGLA